MIPTGDGVSSAWPVVTEARRLYRLHASIVLLGALVVGVAVSVSATRFRLDPGLSGACADLLSRHDVLASACLALLGLGVIAATRFALTFVKLVVAHRRVTTNLRPIGQRDDVVIVEGSRPRAFCAGLVRPRTYVSAGALLALGPDELASVIAHERHHAARHDPLRLVLAASAASGLFFLPVLRRLLDRYADLAEFAADDAACETPARRRALAAALLVFDDAGAGVSPQRVDRLCGARERIDLPLTPLFWAAVAMAGLATTTAAVAFTAARGSVAVLVVAPHAVVGLTLALTPVLLIGAVRHRSVRAAA